MAWEGGREARRLAKCVLVLCSMYDTCVAVVPKKILRRAPACRMYRHGGVGLQANSIGRCFSSDSVHVAMRKNSRQSGQREETKVDKGRGLTKV